MALKSYDEMRKIDVKPYCKERDGILYLNWATCVDLLHQNGAETVYFVPLKNDNGSSLFMSEEKFIDSKENTNRCYETTIEIHIDENTYIMTSPVMNGSNPVKDNSMSQQRVWNSMCRSFVKGVAIYTGLGFDLWANSEKLEEYEEATKNPLEMHDINRIKERVWIRITNLNKKGIPIPDIAAKLNITADELNAYMTYYDILARLESRIEGMEEEANKK